MNKVLHAAAERSIRYLEARGQGPVAPAAEALEGLHALRTAMPSGPSDPLEVLALLDEAGSPATVNTTGGRYFGFVTGGTLPASLGANWLAGAWDQNGALRAMSPVSAVLEEVAISWLLDLLTLPSSCGVGFVTGATMANFSCLAAARHAVLRAAGWDAEADGLFGAPPITVVVGAEVHVSLLKALSMLGLGRKRVVTVPVDGQGRMRADQLPAMTGPTIVCIQAGNVNTGAFDSAEAVCKAAQDSGAWVHVDGAFGLWAAVSPALQHLARGVANADSWATDAHKWLNVPYDCGLAIVRNAEHLRAAFSVQAAYLQTGSEREPSHYTPEASRRARGVEVWAALRSLGRSGLVDLIERCCRHARRFAGVLRDAGFSILNDVELNQVLCSFGTPEQTRGVIAALQADGVCWCGGTVWQGHTAMRISVSSWATTDDDVEQSLAAILRVARAVLSQERRT